MAPFWAKIILFSSLAHKFIKLSSQKYFRCAGARAQSNLKTNYFYYETKISYYSACQMSGWYSLLFELQPYTTRIQFRSNCKNYTRMSETSINHHLIGQATNPKLKRDWHVALAPRSPVFRKMRKTQITQAFNERMNYNMIPFHKSLFRWLNKHLFQVVESIL